jgi:DNA-binding NarL/FixJ family response regulator
MSTQLTSRSQNNPRPARSLPRQRVFRVFVIEGQTAERAILAQIIRRDASFEYDGEAATTADALAMLDAQPGTPDIICLSWLLDGGGVDRWAFVDELRRRCPGARFVMTCPKERPGIVEVARDHGIEVLHATRDSFHSLRRALHHAAQERAYLSPRLQEAAARGPRLNPRQREILGFMAEGASRPEMARRLGLSEATVRSHSKALFERLGVNERAHAVAVGMRSGLIP